MLFSWFFLNTKKPLKPSFKGFLQWSIIPYQEPPGNYNIRLSIIKLIAIIPYQEPPGNYNLSYTSLDGTKLYHTKNHRGTTTDAYAGRGGFQLYHTKNHRGTTTSCSYCLLISALYHTKKPLRTKSYHCLTFPSISSKLKLSSWKPQVSLCIRLIYLRTIK